MRRIVFEDGKWKVRALDLDRFIYECDTKEEIIHFVANEQIYEGKINAIEVLYSFPEGLTVNGVYYSAVQRTKDYYHWLDSIAAIKNWNERFKAIDEKLDEMMPSKIIVNESFFDKIKQEIINDRLLEEIDYKVCFSWEMLRDLFPMAEKLGRRHDKILLENIPKNPNYNYKHSFSHQGWTIYRIS